MEIELKPELRNRNVKKLGFDGNSMNIVSICGISYSSTAFEMSQIGSISNFFTLFDFQISKFCNFKISFQPPFASVGGIKQGFHFLFGRWVNYNNQSRFFVYVNEPSLGVSRYDNDFNLQFSAEPKKIRLLFRCSFLETSF